MIGLNIKQLEFKYPNAESNLLYDININFNKTEIISIEGENASGKTTFLKILASILKIDSNRIHFGEYEIGSKEYKKNVAYIPATPIVFDSLTGIEHMELIADLWEINGTEKIKYKNTFFKLVTLLDIDKFIDKKVGNYSLGTKYKLYFICMISRSPSILLMDEPLTSLDLISQEKASDIIKEISKSSIIIFTSHQSEIIKKLSTKRYCIYNKQIVEQT